MMRKLSILTTSIGGGALLIAVFSVLSKLLGLYRDRLLASEFGASRLTDIYFASFRIPDLVFNILVLGALMSSFIPVFQRVWLKNKKEAIALSNTILNLLLVIVAALSCTIFFLAPSIIPYLVPGFTSFEINTTISMTRIMLLSIIFFTFSNVISGVLNSWKKFLTFSISPILYNLGIIFGITYLYPTIGIFGLAWGVVIGSVLHLIIQLIEALRNGWSYSSSIHFDEHARRIIRLMIPRTVGLAANQINLVVLTILASLTVEGGLSVFNYAQNVQTFPVTIFGVSLAVAAYPSLSESLSNKNHDDFRKLFSQQVRRILFFLIPISIMFLLLRAHIVRVILGSGVFDWTDTILTAQILGFFSLSLISQALIPLLARSFYALEDTVTPVKISIVSIIINILLSLVLVHYFGIIGLAVSFSIAQIFNMVVLFATLHHRFHDLDDHILLISTSKMLFMGLCAGAVTYQALRIFAYLLNTRTTLGIFYQGFFSGLAGLGVYILLSFLIETNDLTLIRRYIKRLMRL